MGWLDSATDFVNDVVDVVTDPVETVVAPIADGAGDLLDEVVDNPYFGPVLDEVADQFGNAGDFLKETASTVHHTGLDHIPAYRAADGLVHDVKHEVSEIDWSNPNSLWGAGASIAGSGIIRTAQARVDTVEQLFGSNETLRLDDLDQASQDYISDIYGDSIEYEDVRLVVGGATTDIPFTDRTLEPHVVGNTVYLPEDYIVTSPTGERTIREEKLGTFGHELGHVWQNQNGGGDYAAEAIGAQLEAWITTGDRNNAYDGVGELEGGTDFADLNPEEQSDVAGEIGEILRNNGTLSPRLAEAHRQIKDGEGAP